MCICMDIYVEHTYTHIRMHVSVWVLRYVRVYILTQRQTHQVPGQSTGS